MIGVERFADPFAARSQQNFAPLVYRVGTLAESGTRSAVAANGGAAPASGHA